MTIGFKRAVPAFSAAKFALLAGFALAGAAGHAAPRAGAVVATLAAPLETPRQEIMDGVMWKCAGDRCSAPAQGSRPLVVCQRVAKQFGTVSGFVSPRGELSAEELTRCNGAR